MHGALIIFGRFLTYLVDSQLTAVLLVQVACCTWAFEAPTAARKRPPVPRAAHIVCFCLVTVLVSAPNPSFVTSPQSTTSCDSFNVNPINSLLCINRPGEYSRRISFQLSVHTDHKALKLSRVAVRAKSGKLYNLEACYVTKLLCVIWATESEKANRCVKIYGPAIVSVFRNFKAFAA